jgi:hypothetical protein
LNQYQVATGKIPEKEYPQKESNTLQFLRKKLNRHTGGAKSGAKSGAESGAPPTLKKAPLVVAGWPAARIGHVYGKTKGRNLDDLYFTASAAPGPAMHHFMVLFSNPILPAKTLRSSMAHIRVGR